MVRNQRAAFLALASAIVVLAAVLRFWGLGLGLPHLMGRPDDEEVLFRTRLPAQGTFDLGWAMYPSAWIYLNWAWGELALRAGALLGRWPRVPYADVLSAHPDRLMLLGRMLTAALGTASVAATIAVARAAFGRAAGLVAGVLLAVNFLHARDSHSMKPDIALSLCIVLALGACLPLERLATIKRGIAAGVAIGAAAACKYPGILLAVPVWIASALGSPRHGWRRLVPVPALAAVAIAAAIFAATSPFLIASSATRELVRGLAAIVFPSLGIANPSIPVPDVQGLGYAGISLPYHLTVSLPVAAGMAGALLAAIAIAWAFISRPPLGVPAAAFLLVWMAVVGLSPIRLMRYLTPVTPVVALLEGGLLAAAAYRFVPRHAAAALVVVTAALAAGPLAATVAHDRLAARTDTRVLATRWLAQHVVPGERVAIAGSVIWGWGQPAMPPGVASLLLRQLDAKNLDDSRASWLVAHDHVLFSSHVDEAALAALGARLTPVAEFDPFVRPRSEARFEPPDAYYLPYAGFQALERPGPRVRIYRVLPGPAGRAG